MGVANWAWLFHIEQGRGKLIVFPALGLLFVKILPSVNGKKCWPSLTQRLDKESQAGSEMETNGVSHADQYVVKMDQF